MDKRLLLGVALIILVVGGGAAGYIFLWLPAQQQTNEEDEWALGLPNSTVPDASLLLVGDTSNITYTLADIVALINNSTIPLIEYNTTISNQTVLLKGFNPVHLYDYAGWNDVEGVRFVASDEYSKVLNASSFMLSDPVFNKGAQGDPSILAIAVNQKWLVEFSPVYGNFSLFGSGLTSGQKVKNVTTLIAETTWQVMITVNGEVQAWLNSSNIQGAGLNYTSFTYGYYDNASGYGYTDTEWTGVTIASVISALTTVTGDYNVTFIAVDGWGNKWVYNETDIENGLTSDHSATINDPAEILSTDGNPILLACMADGTLLTHAGGPYRVIIPGQTKNRWTSYIVEIQITI